MTRVIYSDDNYVVYQDGKEYFRGTCKDVAWKLDVTISNISKAVKTGQKVRRKYFVKYEGAYDN